MDVRAARFVATVTATVLAVVLILAGFSVRAAAVLLSVQALVFAVGAVWGPARHPYGLMFRRSHRAAMRSRDQTRGGGADPVHAQLMGFTFCAVGVAGFILWAPRRSDRYRLRPIRRVDARGIRNMPRSRGPYMLVCRLRGKVRLLPGTSEESIAHGNFLGADLSAPATTPARRHR